MVAGVIHNVAGAENRKDSRFILLSNCIYRWDIQGIVSKYISTTLSLTDIKLAGDT